MSIQFIPEDIDILPAGHEMDALVAEKVMGLSLEHSAFLYQEGVTEAGFYCSRCRAIQGTVGCAKHYSPNIAAAWQVVEKLSVLGWEIKIVRSEDTYFGNEVYLRKLGGKVNWEYLAGQSEILSAICRAALKAAL